MLRYRAKVLKVHRTEDLVDVLFIDFGNKACVPSNKLASLAHQYTTVPGAASECQLAFIVPPEDEEWIPDSMRELQVDKWQGEREDCCIRE